MFRAFDPATDRTVALKSFPLDLTPEQAAEFASGLTRLTTLELAHPSLIVPLAAGAEGSTAYLVEDYFAADSIDIAVRQYGPAPVPDAVRLVGQLAGALDFAAAAGVNHGALHPRDILVAPREVRMTGIGVAAALEAAGGRAPIRRPYAAPERVAGREWGLPADIFSLAALAFELLTGRRPAWDGDTVRVEADAIAAADAPALAEAFARAFSVDAADRHPSALAFAAALKHALTGQPLAPPAEAVRPRRRRSARSGAEHDLPLALPDEPAAPEAEAVRASKGSQGETSRGELEVGAPAAGQEIDAFEAEAPGHTEDVADPGTAVLHREAPAAPLPLAPVEASDAVPPPPAPPRLERHARDFERPGVERDESGTPAAEPPVDAGPLPGEPLVAEPTLRAPTAEAAVSEPTLLDDLDLTAPAGPSTSRRPVPDAPLRPLDESRRTAVPAPPRRKAISAAALVAMLVVGVALGLAGGYYFAPRPATLDTSPASGDELKALSPSSESGGVPGGPLQPVNVPAAPAGGAVSGAAGRAPSTAAPSPSGGAPSSPSGGARSGAAGGTASTTPGGAASGAAGAGAPRAPAATPAPGLTPPRVQPRASQPSSKPAPSRDRSPARETRAASPRPAVPRGGPASQRARDVVFQGGLGVASKPSSARVYLDGRLVGTTPLTLPAVPAGSHVIRLERDGYLTWSSAIQVVAGDQNRVTASLEQRAARDR